MRWSPETETREERKALLLLRWSTRQSAQGAEIASWTAGQGVRGAWITPSGIDPRHRRAARIAPHAVERGSLRSIR